MKAISKISSLVGALALSSLSFSNVIELEELSLFAKSNSWGESVVDTQIGDSNSTFANKGLSIEFSNSLDSDNLGTVVWNIENTSGQAIDDFSMFSFLNADIDFEKNTFYNEYAEYIGNTAADSYEIDEPGYVFGNIYDNLLDGQLDNANATPDSAPEDVSFALGFGLGRLEIGEVIQATIEISLSNIGGIKHSDADSDFSFFFNTSFTRSVVSVSEPGILGLFAIGLLGLFARNRF